MKSIENVWKLPEKNHRKDNYRPLNIFQKIELKILFSIRSIWVPKTHNFTLIPNLKTKSEKSKKFISENCFFASFSKQLFIGALFINFE